MVGRLHAESIELLDLQVKRPSLEDVFLELTGRAYPQANDVEKSGPP